MPDEEAAAAVPEAVPERAAEVVEDAPPDEPEAVEVEADCAPVELEAVFPVCDAVLAPELVAALDCVPDVDVDAVTLAAVLATPFAASVQRPGPVVIPEYSEPVAYRKSGPYCSLQLEISFTAVYHAFHSLCLLWIRCPLAE